MTYETNIIINDVRFPNEVEAVQAWGGKVIRLTRSLDEDQHLSETALDSYEGFDLVLDNANMTIDEQNTALEMYIKEGV